MRYCHARSTLRICFMFVAAIVSAAFSEPVDQIISFDSVANINEDGSILVTETIIAKVGPRQQSKIKHGIFRDFPTKYVTKEGASVRVRFDVLSVRRDGKSEDFHTEAMLNGYRVYMGSKNTMVGEGEHTYEFSYRTTRQLGFFASHDEFYWNVSGDGWAFPKSSVSCSVILPSDVKEEDVSLEAYTGPKGAKGQDFTSSFNKNIAHFQSTKEMPGNEDLTIVVSFPKNIVRSPSFAQKSEDAFFAGAWVLVGLAGFAGVFAYLWFHVATIIRHPSQGPVRYRSKPPEGISPAEARFLMQKGYDNKCLAAVIVNMCVKGCACLELRTKGGGQRRGLDYTLLRVNNDGEKLSPMEHDVLTKIFARQQHVRLEQANHEILAGAKEQILRHLSKKHTPEHFLKRSCILMPATLGVALTTLLVLGIVYPTFFDVGSWQNENDIRPAAVIFLPIMAVVLALVLSDLDCMKPYTQEGRRLADEILGFKLYLSLMDLGCMKPYTHEGRRLADEILGFKLYLSMMMKDTERMHNPVAVDKNPLHPEEMKHLTHPQPREEKLELFEKYLAYAIALDVEKQWATAFERALSDAEDLGRGYQPLWVTGDGLGSANFQVLDFHSFAGDVGSTLETSISHSISPPGSSSGAGGGGSSG
eukprot:CAMPEP_0197466162 /NCGR_PEP_ID=MMETSP1175-20131217/64909_1 /TAXON_ID=1003142 /ORGANISM="Triceratium dubium, Strain CCMP147" /LENGTH=644 /DNA_ID=CAMNT_0043002193 /DNA_START=109 /DNA_END=2039 /DNA_ORIENTATION=+